METRNSNSKVTLALLGERMAHNTALLEEMRVDVKQLRTEGTTHSAEIAGLKEDYHALTIRVNAWSTLNSVLIAIGTALGIIFGNK